MKYVHNPLLTFLLQLLHSSQNYPSPNFISPLFFTIDKPLSHQDLQISTQLKSWYRQGNLPLIEEMSVYTC